MNWSLSVIVPVYNEAQSIEPALEALDEYLSDRWHDYEIVFVESGSTDGTAEICDRLAARYPAVRVIHESAKRGFGSAMKVGYREARKALIWLVTVDRPFHLEAIEQALPLLDSYDCVLSYRSADPRTVRRRFQSWVYNTLIRATLGLPMRHVNSAFKLIKRDVGQALARTVHADGWFFDAELLYRMRRAAVSWTEMPVPLLDRGIGASSVGPLTFLWLLRELLTFVMAERVRSRRTSSDGEWRPRR
jgi:glycosyltransferase involved in cell wall biosynthesis